MDSITERFLMQNGYSFRKTVHRLDQREIPCRWSYERLGEELMKMSGILAEDPDYKIYVVCITVGKADVIPVTVVCQLEKNEIRMTAFTAAGLHAEDYNIEAMKKVEDLTHGRVSTLVVEYTEEGAQYSRPLTTGEKIDEKIKEWFWLLFR